MNKKEVKQKVKSKQNKTKKNFVADSWKSIVLIIICVGIILGLLLFCLLGIEPS